jgi:hypothetical protein
MIPLNDDELEIMRGIQETFVGFVIKHFLNMEVEPKEITAHDVEREEAIVLTNFESHLVSCLQKLAEDHDGITEVFGESSAIDALAFSLWNAIGDFILQRIETRLGICRDVIDVTVGEVLILSAA